MGQPARRVAVRKPERKLDKFIDELIETRVFKTRGQIAAACGTTDAGLSQILGDPHRRLSVEQCLRLAIRTQTDPAELLRMAGRLDGAKLVDQLWPRDSRNTLALTQGERELIEQWRDLTISGRHHVGAVMAMCAETARARMSGASGVLRTAPRAKLSRVTR